MNLTLSKRSEHQIISEPRLINPEGARAVSANPVCSGLRCRFIIGAAECPDQPECSGDLIIHAAKRFRRDVGFAEGHHLDVFLDVTHMPSILVSIREMSVSVGL